jgi:serine phosphatase RsbU (regulator of sigma subunit)/HAMP domain-containing protein
MQPVMKEAAKSSYRFSLRYKIAVPFVTLVFTIMALVTYIFTIRDMNLRVRQVKLRMERLANNIATIRSVGSEDWNLYQLYIENQIKINPDIVYIAIFNEFRDLKAYVLNTNWIETPDDNWDEARIIGYLENRYIQNDSQRDFESVAVNIMIGNQSRGYVHVGFAKVNINNDLTKNLIINLSMGFLFTILAITISFIISQKIVNPLANLTRAMRDITRGRLDHELAIQSNDEIGEMAQTFNFMTRGLREKVEIESFGHELGFTLDRERIFNLITQRITAALQARKSALFIRKNQKMCEIDLAASFPDVIPFKTFRCASGFHEFIKTLEHPCPVDTFHDFPEFRHMLAKIEPLDSRTFICPMKVMDDVIGILILWDRQTPEPYSQTEVTFLDTLIRQAGFALENVLLLDELTEKERMKKELQIAHRVQQNLLPRKPPQITGYQIDGLCQPATEIGGDYFDYFPISSQNLGIVIADVTGKGTSAAFYMAMVKGLMLSLNRIYHSPSQLLCELNQLLYGMLEKKVFITMIYGVLDSKSGILTFSRAGHNSLLVKDGRSCNVDSRVPEGIGLGLEKGHLFDQTIREEMIDLKQNHTVLFYTDGIIEAMNTDGEAFGENRLIDVIQKFDSRSASDINRHVLKAIYEYTGDTSQHDDMTLVTLTASPE